MKIAVTGASGFIGSEVLGVLNKREGVSVTALTRDLTAASAQTGWRCTDYSYESLAEAFEGADAVIHLAGVRGTEDDPEKFAVNVTMTENILKAMSETGAKRIVFASTMSVYNDDDLMPWKESDASKGRSRYGDSKLDCEELIRDFAGDEGNGRPFTYGIARIAQVLGEGEKRRGMMNVFIDAAREGGTLKVMGKSVHRKQYIYVKDLAEILVLLAAGPAGPVPRADTAGPETYRPAGSPPLDDTAGQNITVNVGMKEAYTNLEIAGIVNEVFGNSAPIDYDDSYPEKGRPFVMDTGKLRDELGYVPLEMSAALSDMRKVT